MFLDIVRALDPMTILTEGMETFDQTLAWLRESCPVTLGPAIRSRDGRRIHTCAEASRSVIGVPHLSRNLGRDEMARLVERLRADLV